MMIGVSVGLNEAITREVSTASMMNVAHEVRVKVVHVGGPVSAVVAPPRVIAAVKASMQKVKSNIGENDATMLALELTHCRRR